MNRIVFVQPASIIDTPEIILPSDSSSITATEPQIILIDAKRAYLFSRITVLLCIIPGGILLTPVSLIISAIYYKRAKMEIEKNPGTYSNADQLSYVRNILVGFLIGFICAILIIGALVLLNS